MENANQTQCRVNLKNIYVGVMTWSQDNDDYTVPANWIYNKDIEQYTGASTYNLTATYQCPSVTYEDMKTTQKRNTLVTYGVNGYSTYPVGPSPGDKGVKDPIRGIWGKGMVYWNKHGVTRVSAIRNPSKIIYFMDNENHRISPWNIPFGQSSYRWATRWHRYSDYGYTVANIVTFDGTVAVEPHDIDTNWPTYLYK